MSSHAKPSPIQPRRGQSPSAPHIPKAPDSSARTRLRYHRRQHLCSGPHTSRMGWPPGSSHYRGYPVPIRFRYPLHRSIHGVPAAFPLPYRTRIHESHRHRHPQRLDTANNHPRDYVHPTNRSWRRHPLPSRNGQAPRATPSASFPRAPQFQKRLQSHSRKKQSASGRPRSIPP